MAAARHCAARSGADGSDARASLETVAMDKAGIPVS